MNKETIEYTPKFCPCVFRKIPRKKSNLIQSTNTLIKKWIKICVTQHWCSYKSYQPQKQNFIKNETLTLILYSCLTNHWAGIVGHSCDNPVDISGNSDVYPRKITSSRASAPHADANLNATHENWAASIILNKSYII